jgi:hypothetical protein
MSDVKNTKYYVWKQNILRFGEGNAKFGDEKKRWESEASNPRYACFRDLRDDILGGIYIQVIEWRTFYNAACVMFPY